MAQKRRGHLAVESKTGGTEVWNTIEKANKQGIFLRTRQVWLEEATLKGHQVRLMVRSAKVGH